MKYKENLPILKQSQLTDNSGFKRVRKGCFLIIPWQLRWYN